MQVSQKAETKSSVGFKVGVKAYKLTYYMYPVIDQKRHRKTMILNA